MDASQVVVLTLRVRLRLDLQSGLSHCDDQIVSCLTHFRGVNLIVQLQGQGQC